MGRAEAEGEQIRGNWMSESRSRSRSPPINARMDATDGGGEGGLEEGERRMASLKGGLALKAGTVALTAKDC